MGDERRGGKEEGGRKETFLAGAETQETHCGRRLQGVQVKIDGSPNGALTDDSRPSVFFVFYQHCQLWNLKREESPESPTPPRNRQTLDLFIFFIAAVRLDFILILGAGLSFLYLGASKGRSAGC